MTTRVSAALLPAWVAAWLARQDPLIVYAALLTAWNVVLALRVIGHQQRAIRLARENAAFRQVLQRLGIAVDLTPTAIGVDVTARLADEELVGPPAER